MTCVLLTHRHPLPGPLCPDDGRAFRFIRNLHLAALLAGCLACLGTAASDADESMETHRLLKVQVLDRSGHPISGIRLHPCALRTDDEEIAWDESRHGRISDEVTDADGFVRIEYPVVAGAEQPTVAVCCEVRHSDWIMRRFTIEAGPGEARIRLLRGMRLAVNAVHHDSGEPITDNVRAVLCGDSSYDTWQEYDGGLLLSPTVAFLRSRLRVVWLPENGPPQFSDVIRPLRDQQRARIRIRDVPVAPGTRLQGALADDVPRPITEGYVVAIAAHHAGMRDADRRLEWRDWAPIQPDGTFEFPSLPRDGFVQLFARCDGWVSAKPSKDDLEKAGLAEFRGMIADSFVPLPHVFRLGMKERVCEIRMQRAAMCAVRTVTSAGIPVPGVSVSAQPVQRTFAASMEPYALGISHARLLRLPADQRRLISVSDGLRQLEERGVVISARGFFDQTSDDDGRILVTQLPGGTVAAPSRVRFSVDRMRPEAAGNGRPKARMVELIQGQTTELTVQLDPQQEQPVR